MTGTMLERRYRQLLKCYPRWFRDSIEDEVLGVLMAGARDGQRWPSAAEVTDVLRTALRMRLRLPPPGSQKQGWPDAWAAFSVLAPIVVLAANLAVAEVPPYFVPLRAHGVGVLILYWLKGPGESGTLLFQAAAVIAVLAGWRWVALAVTLGSAWYMLTGPQFRPSPAALLMIACYLLETAALLASPGPRRGRTLLTWGHGVVLVLAVAAVKLFSLTWFVIGFGDEMAADKPLADILLAVAAVLAAAAVAGPATLRQGGRASLLMAGLLYPYAIEFAYGYAWSLRDESVQFRLAVLFLLPLALAMLAPLTAARAWLASSGARLTPGS